MTRPHFSLSEQKPSKRKKWEAKEVYKTQNKGPMGLDYGKNLETRNNLGKCNRKCTSDMIGYCSEDKSPVMERVNEILAALEAKFPSFVKSMLSSHVSGGFWLGLPKKSCVMHLPKHDDTVILEDESGKKHITKYLVDKTGLSAGWRGFSIEHKLVAGDVLVFQLVRPCKMKVYIVRSNGLAIVDGALDLLNLNTSSNRIDFVQRAHNTIPKDGFMISNDPINSHSKNESENFGSDVMKLEGIRLSESAVDFNEVKSIENFTIHVNGLVIDSEFSKHVRTKYYELCCSQNSFLHDHLLKGLNYKLAAGIISETINIADAIRTYMASMSQENLVIWENTLRAFQVLGMKVGFLRRRLEELSHILRYSQKADELKRKLF